MGFVANNEELQLRQPRSDELQFLTIPATPENTPVVTMSDPAGDHMAARGTEIQDVATSNNCNDTPTLEKESSPPEHYEPAARRISTDENYTDGEEDSDEYLYASLDPNTTLAIPITNPSAFPIQRLQEVQAQYYPSTHVTNMLVHKTPSGPITKVAADIQDGSVNHLFIRDTRLINALGLALPAFDTINLDTTQLRLDETFTIDIFPGQRPNEVDEWIMGDLVSARHAYLYWLDERRSADPRSPPYAAEAKAIARKTGRRYPDVMREIEGVWKLEQGSNGREYRENRVRYLGENPTYPEGAEEKRVVRSMFG
ncbi:hypothetical protein BU25DRAFT_43011 [Macroventuria anomochaeta]|uniref:Uncharacterized protein n=1 Tax=Macroventuria anomochaeta TaxID=301207 RepID=A0ACB6S213_9PLEO|nr:uncharacterized protein BU25DRAFT_43011 [Macroventuria anomochaeta]KAF2628275.1 hypothetical protein BU25DRAFT_43011 [Macroventuria anomochaeta]